MQTRSSASSGAPGTQGGRFVRGAYLPAAHDGGQVRFVQAVLGGKGRGHFALAQNQDLAGQIADFVELVADEDHPHAGCGHGPQGPEQPLGLLGGKRCRGLVEDEDPCAAHQGLDDLQALLFAHGQVSGQCPGVEPQAVALPNFVQAGKNPPAPQAPPGTGLAHQKVFQHAVAAHQVIVLVHHAHTGGQGIGAAANLCGPAVDADAARIGIVDPEENVHQGGLARPVFPQKAEYITGV